MAAPGERQAAALERRVPQDGSMFKPQQR